jgi:hypothetical protein
MECSYCGLWRTNAADPCPACGTSAVGPGVRPAGAMLRAWRDAHKAQATVATIQQPEEPSSPVPSAGNQRRAPMGLLARYGGTGKLSTVTDQPAFTSLQAAEFPQSPAASHPADGITGAQASATMPASTMQLSAGLGPAHEEPPIATDHALMPPLPELRLPDIAIQPDQTRATVYIPASLPRRRYTLSNWHIISGVISLLVVLLAACSLSGYWATSHFNLLAHKSLPPLQPPSLALSVAPAKAIPGPAAKIIQTAAAARSFSVKYEPVGVTSTFATGQYVYIVYKVRTKTSGTVTCQWYQNGVELEPQVHPVLGSVNGYFAMSFPSAGTGKAELYWNGILAQTVPFTIMDK